MKTLAREVMESHGLKPARLAREAGVDSRCVRRYLDGLEVQAYHARLIDTVLIDALRGARVEVIELEAAQGDVKSALVEERAVNRMLELENQRLRRFAQQALRAVA